MTIKPPAFLSTGRPRLMVWLLLLVLNPLCVQAQLCFDVFEELTDPTLDCADTFYFVDGPDGGDDIFDFGDSDTGLLNAEFDGFDLFDEPDVEPPDNLLEPFFSDTQFRQTTIGGQIESFQTRHRGSLTMGPRESRFQSAVYGTRSRITFIPVMTDGSTDPVILDLDFEFDFTLTDPSDNATRGAASAGAGVDLFGDDLMEPEFDFSGLAELDLDDLDEPQFFEDFDGPASSFEPSGPDIDDKFDIEIEFETTFEATPGKPLTLDTDTFGSIFTDGFESGDTAAWSASSGNTFVFTVSSSNPNVRFRLVLGPPDPPNISRVRRFTDFNKDGKDDVLLRHKDTGRWVIDFMKWRQVLPNSGPTPIFTSLDWEMIGTGDFSGNGYGDILLRNRITGGWWMFFMKGRSNVNGATLITRNQDWVVAAIDDFDGDGKDDVMMRHRVTGRWQIYFMKFRQVQPHSGFTALFNNLDWEMMGTGDFNMDGRADVLLRNRKTGAWWIYLMNGLLRTGGPAALFKTDNWVIMGIDDFDGDGKDDVLLRNVKTGRWYINFMDARNVRPDSGFTPMFKDFEWQMMGTGDFNCDGHADVLLQNQTTGEWWIYLMNGLAFNSGTTPITTDQDWRPPQELDDG